MLHFMRNLVSDIHWRCHTGNCSKLTITKTGFVVLDKIYVYASYGRSLHKANAFEDPKFQVPVFVVMGEKDYVYKFPGIESVLKDGIMEKFVPDLKIAYIPEGSHFVQEQFPDKVNDLLVRFLKDHPVSA